MPRSKRLRICVIPEGRGPVRQFNLRSWFFPVVILGVLTAVGGLGIFSWHSHALLSGWADQAAELETLRQKNAAQADQLKVFDERVSALDQEVAKLRGHEDELKVLAADIGGQLGLAADTPLSEIIPMMQRNVAWARENRNGMGGGEVAGALSLSLGAGQNREFIRGMHRDLDRLMDAADETEKQMAVLKNELTSTSSILAATPKGLPMDGRLSSRFGYRRSPFGGASDLHRGLDMPAPIGTPIYATANGTVISADHAQSGYGLMLTIDHGYGLVTRYAHLSQSLVEPGADIKRGQKIALVGNTGRSTGPHLHYETIIAGVPVNPLKITMNIAPELHDESDEHETTLD